MSKPTKSPGRGLSEATPESESILVTEVRGEGPDTAPRATTPSPAPDPDVISKARGEDALQHGQIENSTPSPETEEGSISHARGEDSFATHVGGDGRDGEKRETSIRGDDISGDETRSRGEDPDRVSHGSCAETGTFNRGESDFDPSYPVGQLTKSESRGEADFDLSGTRLSAYADAGTESRDGRGSVDYDQAGWAVHDAALDDPTDLRRVTVLGAIESRQRAKRN